MITGTIMSFPPVWWWARIIKEDNVDLDIAAQFRKMTWNNRYRIAAANGPLLLSIPILGGREQRIPVKEIRIDNRTKWQQQHWRSIFSAYGRAPFFEHYAPELEALIHLQHENLATFNAETIRWAAKAIRLKTTFNLMEHGHPYGIGHPPASSVAYAQVFDDRNGFIPELSVIDLLMNEGPAAGSLLLEEHALQQLRWNEMIQAGRINNPDRGG